MRPPAKTHLLLKIYPPPASTHLHRQIYLHLQAHAPT
uniref:Uncharacterized protein n=1 Tax=Anguilla anguilla TaxID=7936 RepID=A0A0E9W2W4_ANGAN